MCNVTLYLSNRLLFRPGRGTTPILTGGFMSIRGDRPTGASRH